MDVMKAETYLGMGEGKHGVEVEIEEQAREAEGLKVLH